MENFADRLIAAVKSKGTSCVVGLDPRVDQMPRFVWEGLSHLSREEALRKVIGRFHETIIEAVAPWVPAVKPQSAFFEQYGLGGIQAFQDTIVAAKRNGLLVIVDAKRNDISSTAQAYANAYLGSTPTPGGLVRAFDVDCLTVSPFLGRDSLLPFVETCREHGKGVFVLVKTSNRGSTDFQDQLLAQTNERLYLKLANLVDELAALTVGKSGYSSIGAVVGATFPEEADVLRKRMPRSIFLVPGYGAQGGTAKDALHCFNSDGLGAVVSASRSVTYGFESPDISRSDFRSLVEARIKAMVSEIAAAATNYFTK